MWYIKLQKHRKQYKNESVDLWLVFEANVILKLFIQIHFWEGHRFPYQSLLLSTIVAIVCI